jgi:hypothetical protein
MALALDGLRITRGRVSMRGSCHSEEGTMKRAARSSVLATIALAALAASCAEPQRSPTDIAVEASASASTLLLCPASESRRARATVGYLGGVVSVGGHAIVLPQGAVLQPTEITVTVPASRYLEVDIRADDRDSFQFRQPAVVVIDYSRCDSGRTKNRALTAWHIDTGTRALLEHMGGVDDKLSRTVTFTTPHLSGFALAD